MLGTRAARHRVREMMTLVRTEASAQRRVRTLTVPSRIGAAGAMAMAASPALSQDLSPITAVFTTVATAISGPIGQALAILAVAIAGILLIVFERFNGPYLAALIVGVVLIFRADEIVAGFTTP